ncbi:Lysophospholipid acyltransferase LPEAT2 [Acorus calamus]|uniref:Lysophospholipid acyltransferase LPEAT2 n=2 Tax=Acorus calamus TaxID=4465 RepID=A0AAV9D2P7_ACOCL|nr:Lysophospholipid acyltransferase LPEAT2 [Acorus calamus]
MAAEPPSDLDSPLLPQWYSAGESEPEVIVVITSDEEQQQQQKPSENVIASDYGNPFDFLGASLPSLPPPTPADPFRNHTPNIEGLYEWAKTIVCLPIAAVRMVMFGLCLAVGYVATKVALEGWKDRESPMPRWRQGIMWITRLCSRFILFSFGYHWIRRIGKPVSREIAPIVVSNHVSYIEPIFFFYELFPTIVASESHDSIPFVGTIIRAMQVIYVNRFSPMSRKHAVNEIKRKASCDEFPRVLLFPEGTTTNGRFLISFQLGAFIPGFPIQPVVVRYPYIHFDQSWGHISLVKLMFRMFTQFHNFMEVEYLPVITPRNDKQENAIHFAERASHVLAGALNVLQTSHSYGDLMLLTKAAQLGLDNVSEYTVEMAWVERSFNISTSEAIDFLDKFLSMKPDSRGHVNIQGFSAVLRLGLCPFTEKIFTFLDVEKCGYITFRQFLLGSAYVLKQPLFKQACIAAYDKFDDGHGYMSMRQLGNLVQHAVPNLHHEKLGQLFKLFNVDDDGLISRDDFMSCLRRNPLLIALFAAHLNFHISLEVL